MSMGIVVLEETGLEPQYVSLEITEVGGIEVLKAVL